MPEVSFLNKPFKEQVEIAIDCSDPKLLQVLLELENCQLWEYWLTHSLLLHNIFGIVKTLKYQLPLNILTAQSQVLAKSFPRAYRAYRALPTIDEIQPLEELETIFAFLRVDNRLSQEMLINQWSENITTYRSNTTEINKVNRELESAEQEVLEKYKSFKYESVDNKYQVSSVQNMYDPVGKYAYSYYSDDYTEVNNCVREVAEKFKNNLVIQPVLKLDLSNHYNEIYEEIYNEIIKDYNLRIEEGQFIYPLYEGNESLAKKSSKLRESDNKLQSILSCISREVVSKIKNEEFITEVYDRLVDHVLDISSKDKNHPLHKECCDLGQDTVKKKIKEQVKENSDYRLLNGFLEYAVDRRKPNTYYQCISCKWCIFTF